MTEFAAGTRVELAWEPHRAGVVQYLWTAESGQPYVFVAWDDVWHLEGWDEASQVRKRSATSMRPGDLRHAEGPVSR